MASLTVQKAGILRMPEFSGCLEHINVIWQQIQSAKKGEEGAPCDIPEFG